MEILLHVGCMRRGGVRRREVAEMWMLLVFASEILEEIEPSMLIL